MGKAKVKRKYHFFNGNVKVGNMYTWNTLAGRSLIKGCMGTCGKYCTGCWNTTDWKKSSCYVPKSYVQYKDAVLDPHIRNTKGMRSEMNEVFKQLDGQLSRARNTKPVRIHSSGEIESAQELRKWFELAQKHPERQFYVYTKAYDILDQVLPTTDIPDNFYINISIWHQIGIPSYNKYKVKANVRAFVYDDKFDYSKYFKIDCHCPAYDSSGKMDHTYTCDKCKICFSKFAKVCACYDH